MSAHCRECGSRVCNHGACPECSPCRHCDGGDKYDKFFGYDDAREIINEQDRDEQEEYQ